jgi:hypothetical protein
MGGRGKRSMKTKEEIRAYYENKMKQGKASFVLYRGILSFGVPLSVALCLPVILRGRPTLVPVYITCPLVAVISGTIYGFLNWYIIRRQYNIPTS